MEHLQLSDCWAAARQEKIDAIDILPQSKALLGVLKIINQEGGAAAETRVLEGLVYLAHHQELDGRLFKSLKSYDNPDYSPDWRLGFCDRMNYFQQQRYVIFGGGCWQLSPEGEQVLDNYIEENGVLPIQPHEIEAVLEITRAISAVTA